jgi:hypothetical protein
MRRVYEIEEVRGQRVGVGSSMATFDLKRKHSSNSKSSIAFLNKVSTRGRQGERIPGREGSLLNNFVHSGPVNVRKILLKEAGRGGGGGGGIGQRKLN